MTWFLQVLCLMLLPDYASSYGFLSWLDDAQAAMDSVADGSTFDEHPNSEDELRKDLAVAGVEVSGADADTNDPDLSEGRNSRNEFTDFSNQVPKRQGFENTIDAESFANNRPSHLKEGEAEPSDDQELQKRMNRVLRNIENGGEEMLSTEAIDASVAALDRRDDDIDDLLESGYIHANPSRMIMQNDNEDPHDDLTDEHVSAANIERYGASSSEDEEAVLEDSSQRIADEELQEQAPVATHPNTALKLGPLRQQTNENWASTQNSTNKNNDTRSALRKATSQASTIAAEKTDRFITKANSSRPEAKSKAELDVEALSSQFTRMKSIYDSTQKYHLNEEAKSSKKGKHNKHGLHSKQHSHHGVAKRAVQGSRKSSFSKKLRDAGSPRTGAVAVKLKSESVSANPDTQTNKVGSKRLTHVSPSPIGSVAVKLKSQQSSSHIGAPQTEKKYGRSQDMAQNISAVKAVIAMKLTMDAEVEQMPSLEVSAQSSRRLGVAGRDRVGRSSVKVHNQTHNTTVNVHNQTHNTTVKVHNQTRNTSVKVHNQTRNAIVNVHNQTHNTTVKVHNQTRNTSVKVHNQTRNTTSKNVTFAFPKVFNRSRSSRNLTSDIRNNSTKPALNRTNSSHKSGSVAVKLKVEYSSDVGTQTSKKAISIAAQRHTDSEAEAVENVGATKSREILVAPRDEALENDVTDAISQAEDVLRADSSVA